MKPFLRLLTDYRFIENGARGRLMGEIVRLQTDWYLQKLSKLVKLKHCMILQKSYHR